MTYTVRDFWRDITKEHLDSLTPNERLAGISPDELLAAMPTEQLREVVRKAELKLARSPDKKEPQAKSRAKSRRTAKRGSH